MLTIVQRDNVCVSERIPIFVTEFPDRLPQVARQRHFWVPFGLVDLLADAVSETYIFKRYIKILADCEDGPTRKATDIIRDDRFHRVLVKRHSAKKGDRIALCV